MPGYRHVVLFRLHAAASADHALVLLRGLGDQPGVLEWRVELSVDTRKGAILVENALFVDVAAFQDFRTSAAHQAVSAQMSQLADWWVADYFEEITGQ